MFSPWQTQPMIYAVPMRAPLLKNPTGAFPVPQALDPRDLPPAVKDALMRVLDAPPKPAVTLQVMNQAQASMIAPDLPYRADV